MTSPMLLPLTAAASAIWNQSHRCIGTGTLIVTGPVLGAAGTELSHFEKLFPFTGVEGRFFADLLISGSHSIDDAGLWGNDPSFLCSKKIPLPRYHSFES